MIEILLALITLLALFLVAYTIRLFRTERMFSRQARLDLQQTQRILQGILHDSPVGVLTCDSSGLILNPSESFLQLYKVTQNEVDAKSFWDFIDADHLAAAKGLLQRAQSHNRGEREVLLTHNSLCEQIWSQVNVVPMGNEFLVTLVNVSSSVKNKELLERFQQGLDQVQILVITDRNGVITYANEAFCRTSGYRAEEIIGKTPAFLNSGFHDREFFEQMWTTILSGKTWKGTFRNKNKEGEIFWLETSIAVFTDDSGSPQQFLAVSQEVTARKAAEENLQANLKKMAFENKIWRVIDRVQTNLMVLKTEEDMLSILLQIVCEDLEWDFGQVYVRETGDDGIERMVHWQSFALNPLHGPSLLAAASIRPLLIDEDLPGQAWRRKAPVWKRGDAVNPIRDLRGFSDKGFFLQSGLCVPLMVNEDLYGVVELLSEAPRAEEERLARAMVVIASYFGKVLEREIRDKKEFQYREQLALSAKMSTLGEMASGIAHEINNPLSIIIGYAQGARKHLDKLQDPERQHLLRTFDRIVATSQRIGKIVKGLRSFARDGSADEFLPSSVRGIIEDSISICEAKIKKAEVSLHYPPLDDALIIECRAVQISQIIINLISNGVDAIANLEDRWIRIEVEDKSDEVEIVVTDSGSGIPEDLAQKIMQPFFTTKAVGQGTGLGLSIARGIADSHSGQFGLDRQRPNTSFFLRLPKKQKSQETKEINKAS